MSVPGVRVVEFGTKAAKSIAQSHTHVQRMFSATPEFFLTLVTARMIRLIAVDCLFAHNCKQNPRGTSEDAGTDALKRCSARHC